MRPRRRHLHVLVLFFLAPCTGEFVLGNQPVTALPELLLLAPVYGGAAVLIREAGRRTRRGWTVMAVLAVAYALVEEGLIDQMIFNPAYLGLASFADYAAVPGLGTSARLTLESVALHATGSTCVPIVLAEAFDREEPRPWLGRRGLVTVAAVFAVGSTGLAVLQAVGLDFVGSPAQWAVTSAAVAGLVVLAVRVSRREPPRSGERVAAPSRPARPPRVVLAAAFACTTGFWVVDLLAAPVAGGWVSVAGGTLVLALGVASLARESRRRGWDPARRLAVACGALTTYLWLAPVNTAQLGVPRGVGVAGNVLFGTGAVVPMVAAGRALGRGRDRRARPGPPAQGSDGS